MCSIVSSVNSPGRVHNSRSSSPGGIRLNDTHDTTSWTQKPRTTMNIWIIQQQQSCSELCTSTHLASDGLCCYTRIKTTKQRDSKHNSSRTHTQRETKTLTQQTMCNVCDVQRGHVHGVADRRHMFLLSLLVRLPEYVPQRHGGVLLLCAWSSHATDSSPTQTRCSFQSFRVCA